jgi:hypothetical protein
MKHVTYAEKSLLIGDEAATLLLEYAAALGTDNSADTVELNAIGAEGNDVAAIFLLGPGVLLMAETATTKVAEPDNEKMVTYMRERMERMASPPNARAYAQDDFDKMDHSSLD